jgi:hypothetical protein
MFAVARGFETAREKCPTTPSENGAAMLYASVPRRGLEGPRSSRHDVSDNATP